MNQKLIKQLQNGEIAVKNDGTLEEVEQILSFAFPEDEGIVEHVYGKNTIFTFHKGIKGDWSYFKPYDSEYKKWQKLSISVKEFFKPDELTLQELTEMLYEKAKKEGFNCDVVLEERKGISVKPIVMAPVPEIKGNVYIFSFDLSNGYIPDYGDHVKIGEMFEEYINKK